MEINAWKTKTFLLMHRFRYTIRENNELIRFSGVVQVVNTNRAELRSIFE